MGDFGRAERGVLHDEIMPTVGRERAKLAGDSVSRFNTADEEREMHDRIWRYLVSPHAEDWFYDVAVELRRTRITTGSKAYNPARYYKWIKTRQYESSRVRFLTIAGDIETDISTMPSTFAAICAVVEMDRQRAYASKGLGGLEADNVRARKQENDIAIGWFVQAAAWRYEAYAYTLDHLLVETPHAEAVKANTALNTLARWVERAQRADFCISSTTSRYAGDENLPSRVLIGDGKPYRK